MLSNTMHIRLVFAFEIKQNNLTFGVPVFCVLKVLHVLKPRDPKERYLERSAELIRSWVQPDPITEAFLSARNDVDLVLILSEKGPKFVLKRQTAACKRLNQNVYYDNGFANLVIGLLLKHAGKVLPVFNDLSSQFVCDSGSDLR